MPIAKPLTPARLHVNRAFGTGFIWGLFTGVGFYVASNYKRRKREQQDKTAESDDQSSATQLSANDTSMEDVGKLERGRQILKYGCPDNGSQVRYYGNHVLVYNQQKKTPVWVAEHLTSDSLKGTANRKHAKFKADPGIEDMFTAANNDYYKSGWSRGHLAPAGDNKINQEAMDESFYLSNIVPQNYENNAGFWNRLEMYCRELASKYPSVYIISGPLILPEVTEDGKKFVKYELIGANRVAVPTHLYKVIIVENKHGRASAMGAFVVPNKPIGFDHHLKEYQVELASLEQLSGIKLAPNLDTKQTKDLCKVDGCNLIDRNTFELYFIGRKLESANTMQRLDKVWSELQEKNLKPDKYLSDLYLLKKMNLEKISEESS